MPARSSLSRVRERVKALVYVTALAPDEGEKVADVFYRLPPHPQAPKLAPDSNGLIWLPEGAFATAFAQNASADDQAVLAAVQRPISLNCITVPAGRPLWKDVPSWFLVAEARSDDRARDAALHGGTHEGDDQRRMPSITRRASPLRRLSSTLSAMQFAP